jgi:hypothetical protein
MISERARRRLENRKRLLFNLNHKEELKLKEQKEREEYFTHRICPDCGADFMEVVNWRVLFNSAAINQRKFRCVNCGLTFWYN